MFNKKAYQNQWHKDNLEYMKQYRINNREEILEQNKIWQKNNPKHMKEYKKQYRIDNIEEIKDYMRKYYIDNKEEMLKYNNQWRRGNPEKVNEYNKKWRKDNPEYVRKDYQEHEKYKKQWAKDNPEYYKQWQKNKYKKDLKFHLNCRIGHAIWKSLKGNKNNRHWEDLAGYTLNDLVKRLKQTMPEGYTWQDYMEGKLHIDHIIPISVFNFDKPSNPDFKNCWALDNLRLLPAKDNYIKHNKIFKPFQPALRIC